DYYCYSKDSSVNHIF
nr:immunoglobulin light chain junction region [Macaca mulatta]MOW31774.1 immunoglobulin light chain junction region [Macaca mulatta]